MYETIKHKSNTTFCAGLRRRIGGYLIWFRGQHFKVYLDFAVHGFSLPQCSAPLSNKKSPTHYLASKIFCISEGFKLLFGLLVRLYVLFLEFFPRTRLIVVFANVLNDGEEFLRSDVSA